ncbi:MAG: hypothetical protein KDE26_23685, partial [Bacteroidetes bacterium]|nr:hypothetical protein [Bacteroidota bacterium]
MKTFTMFMLGMSAILMASGQCVYFSEYLEGTGNNKCLEVYNGTGNIIDLAAEGYTIYMYANGSNSHTGTVALSGILAPSEVMVVCHPGADSAILSIADQTSGNVNFNGDDAVELVNNLGSLDVIGEIGFDPGSEWVGITCTDGTANGTMQRKANLACPGFNGSSSFDPDLEWDCFPVNTFSDLGSHTMTACVITDFELIMDSCANGIADASLHFYVNNSASSAFELMISPDPGGYSGVYNYVGSLPFSISGLAADSITSYDLVIRDTADTSCSAQINNLIFDCPIANQLSFASIPPGCVGVNNQFIIEVCAIDSISGKIQSDYQDTIHLVLNPGASGIISGNLSEVATGGCASFSLSYDL